MGLLCLNLMVFTLLLSGATILAFGIVFAVTKKKAFPGQLVDVTKRSKGVGLIIVGAILTPLLFVLTLHLMYKEAAEGADIIGGGTIFYVLLLFGWLIIPAFILILVFYIVTGITYIASARKNYAGLDHLIFGVLLICFSVVFTISAFGTLLPPSFNV